jgi:hypothetical protein
LKLFHSVAKKKAFLSRKILGRGRGATLALPQSRQCECYSTIHCFATIASGEGYLLCIYAVRIALVSWLRGYATNQHGIKW